MITTYRRNRPARIVLAEDDRTTASLIKIALQRTGVSHDLCMVHDGDSAIAASSSETPGDINRAYDLHANAYVLKHPDFSDLCRSLDAILNFWLRTAIIPVESCR